MLSLVAYPAPLPGEWKIAGSGIAFWNTPLASTLFSGPSD